MDCRLQPIVIANDVDLESERSGEAAIYWNPQSQWRAMIGASSFVAAARALSIDAAATVRLYAQYSYDGLSWTERSGVLLDDITDDAGSRSDQARIFLTNDELGMPFWRFGVEVGGGSTYVQARIFASIVPIGARDRSVVSQFISSSTAIPASGTDIGTSIVCSDASSAAVHLSGTFSGAGSADIEAYSSDDASVWAPTGVSATLDATNPAAMLSLDGTKLGQRVKLKVTTSNLTNSPTLDAATASLRNF